MLAPRQDQAATLLGDGSVLLAGGSNEGGGLTAAELYVPVTRSWMPAGRLAIPRAYGHTATLLRNDRVLVAGGIDADGVSLLNSCELYDPDTMTWTATGAMLTARILFTSTLLGDGRVLVSGGADNGIAGGALATAELYDPVSGTWTATGSMTTARVGHTATLLTDGRVLVTGGWDGGGEGAPPVSDSVTYASAEIYDPETGSWTNTGSMLTARAKHVATLLADGGVLVTGGGALASAELFDPGSGTWSTTASMAVPRQSHTATLVRHGDVLVMGGGAETLVELYDAARRTWSKVGTMDLARSGYTVTLLDDGAVLVAGGSGDGGALSDAVLFDPGSVTAGLE
jgi:hypothetical protein